MNSDNIGQLLLTIIIVAFIGGCTYTLSSDSVDRIMKTCIDADMNYVDGDCVAR